MIELSKGWCFAMATVALLLTGPAPGSSPGMREGPETRVAGGSVRGKVVFAGKAPKDRKISLEGDKFCSAARPEGLTSEFYKIGPSGVVQNVFVYVKKGLEGRTFDVPQESVVLDQVGCRYEPHVFGVRVGQTVIIKNSDDTLHNVHGQPQLNKEINFGQARKGEEAKVTFTTPEVMIRIKCDVHGWMSSFAGVVSHPHFKVTGEDGAFEFKDLPPGEYTIEAWHEKFGSQVQTVKVDESAGADLSFIFKGR